MGIRSALSGRRADWGVSGETGTPFGTRRTRRIGKVVHMKKVLLVMVMVAALGTSMLAPAMATEHCEATDAGTANFVNTVPSEPFEVTCDIGIYFDEDGVIDDVDISSPENGGDKTGIYVDGADVDLSNSAVSVADGYTGQFVSVAYHDGATGAITGNSITGAHRAGILVRGSDVTVVQNEVIGTGEKTSGWAENGIQVDEGSVASITNNVVANHWWDGESNFASSGVILASSTSAVNGNDFTNNEFSVYIIGGSNEVKSNRVESHVVSQSSLNFRAYGILVFGNDNTLIGNQLRATDGAAGIYLSGDNLVRGGNIKGFETPILSVTGDDTFTGNPALVS